MLMIILVKKMSRLSPVVKQLVALPQDFIQPKNCEILNLGGNIFCEDVPPFPSCETVSCVGRIVGIVLITSSLMYGYRNAMISEVQKFW